jgi:hypothetical protein
LGLLARAWLIVSAARRRPSVFAARLMFASPGGLLIGAAFVVLGVDLDLWIRLSLAALFTLQAAGLTYWATSRLKLAASIANPNTADP